MTTIQWVAGAFLLALSALVIILNWAILAVCIRTRRHISGIPVVGGLAGILGLLILPVEGAFSRFWWVPPLVGYGFAFSIVGAMYLALSGGTNSLPRSR